MDTTEDDDQQSYYAILNLPPTATLAEIKRAYRTAAQFFHPDKHIDDAAKPHAEEAFSKLQQAYEVLSDPAKRQVYDVYGKQGLAAGLEVGEHFKSAEELRAEWKKFKEQQQQQQQDAGVSHRGYYMIKLHAADLWDKLLHGSDSRAPTYRAIAASNTLDLQTDESGWATFQGQTALKGTTGVGSFVCGYRRMISPQESIEAQAVMGLRNLFSATATRQLTSHDSARLTALYNAQDGVGLEFGLMRQLYEHSNGSFTWVLGPSAAAGMSLALTHRANRWVLLGKLEVGSSTGLVGKATYLLNDSVSIRLGLKLAVSNVELEVGTNYKYSQRSSLYLGTAVGFQGILIRGRYTRQGQVFDCPIMITEHSRSPVMLLAAMTLPSLTYLAVSRFVVRPMLRWHKLRQEQQATAEQLQDLKQAVLKAFSELNLISTVATRKAAAEADKQGLLILEAVYGELDAYYESVRYTQQGPLLQQLHRTAQTAFSGSFRWLDVTPALQYMTADSKLSLHQGVPKSGLMGFCSFGGDKDKACLFVGYMHKGRVYEVQVGSLEGLELPGAVNAEEVTSVDKLQYYRSKAARYGLALPQ